MKEVEVMRARLEISGAEIPSEPEKVALELFGTPPKGWRVDGVSVTDWDQQVEQVALGRTTVTWYARATIKLWREVGK